MVHGASSRVPAPCFEGRFFNALLSTLISISVFADVTQRVKNIAAVIDSGLLTGFKYIVWHIFQCDLLIPISKQR